MSAAIAPTALVLTFVDVPPALLAWIDEHRQVALRVASGGAPGVGDRERVAEYVVLIGDEQAQSDAAPIRTYRITSRWEPTTASELADSDYPDPRGVSYLVAALEPTAIEADEVWSAVADSIKRKPERYRARTRFGLPHVLWLESARRISEESG